MRWQGRELHKLTAVWSEAMTNMIAPNRQWPPFLPRKCCLFLDGKDSQTPYWPYRIEWWGPASSQMGEALLLQMEFRNPKLAVAPESVARQFVFDPGNAPVKDLTKESTELAKERGRQLAAQKKGK
jgi:hypothetical protein